MTTTTTATNALAVDALRASHRDELLRLIPRYFELGRAEGADGRDHDTPDDAANAAWSRILYLVGTITAPGIAPAVGAGPVAWMKRGAHSSDWDEFSFSANQQPGYDVPLYAGATPPAAQSEHPAETALRNIALAVSVGGFNSPTVDAVVFEAKILAGIHDLAGLRAAEAEQPVDGEVLVIVSGLTGSGKSAVAGEIEILCKALGLTVEWRDGQQEKNLTHADWTTALELYKPKIRIVEKNVSRASRTPPPAQLVADTRLLSALAKYIPPVLGDTQNAGEDQLLKYHNLRLCLIEVNKALAGTRSLGAGCVAIPPAEAPGVLSMPLAPCNVPPAGWTCSRGAGHPGPCAATPAEALGDRSMQDTARLDFIENECQTVRCETTGDDDVIWEAVSYHMTPPTERIEGAGSTPRDAIDAAMEAAMAATRPPATHGVGDAT